MKNVKFVLREFLAHPKNRGQDQASVLAFIYLYGGLSEYCLFLQSQRVEKKLVASLVELIPAEDEVIETLIAQLPSGLIANNHAKLKEVGLLREFIQFRSEFSGKIISANRYNDGKYVVIKCLRTNSDGEESIAYFSDDSCIIWDSWEKAMLSQMFEDLVLPAVNRLLPQD